MREAAQEAKKLIQRERPLEMVKQAMTGSLYDGAFVAITGATTHPTTVNTTVVFSRSSNIFRSAA